MYICMYLCVSFKSCVYFIVVVNYFFVATCYSFGLLTSRRLFLLFDVFQILFLLYSCTFISMYLFVSMSVYMNVLGIHVTELDTMADVSVLRSLPLPQF